MTMQSLLKHLTLLWLVSYATASEYRLDHNMKTDIYPTSYNLHLTLNSDEATFSGEITISLQWKNNEPKSSLRLHASPNYINITSVSIGNVDCKVNETNADTEIIEITCENGIKKGDGLLIKYTGIVSMNETSGIYKTTYMDDDGEKTIIATAFKPIYARRAFPCFDEPEFKTPFTIAIKHPQHYKALSNAPIWGKPDISANEVTSHFKVTPKMSTYLVGFVLSELVSDDEILGLDKTNAYDYKVYSRKAVRSNMGMACQYGQQLIDMMGEWTGTPYDQLGNNQAYQIALPNSIGDTLEDWGLISYREGDLFDEGNVTANVAKQNIMKSMAHKLSSQWFGDSVTADWWSDIWLNEGFAKYFEYHLPSAVFNVTDDFELEKQFIFVIQEAFWTDAQSQSPPLHENEDDVNTQDNCTERFDTIIYSKGASVLRMMSYVLGPDLFKKAMSEYLTKRKNKSVNSKLLLSVFQETVNNTITDFETMMDTWIASAGYPLVTVKLSDDSSKLVLSQERFNNPEDATRWWIPVSYATNATNSSNFEFELKGWVSNESEPFLIDYEKDTWIIFNVQASGYYRVNYEDVLWDRIIEALNGTDKENIHVLNRAQLVDDIYAIAKTGKVSYKKAFALTEFLKNETSYYPWVSALNAFSFMLGKLDSASNNLLKKMLLEYIEKVQEVSEETGNHIDVLKSALFLDWLCYLGKKHCVDNAVTEFSDYKKNIRLLDNNIRYNILCYGLKHSTDIKADYEIILNIFNNSQSLLEQKDILLAMACMNNEEYLLNYLHRTIEPESFIKKQDAPEVLRAVYTKSENGVNAALKFLNDYFGDIESVYSGHLAPLMSGLANVISTDKQRETLTRIISDNGDNKEIKFVEESVINILKANKDWVEKYQKDIKDVLKKMFSAGNNLTPVALTVTISFVIMVFNLI